MQIGIVIGNWPRLFSASAHYFGGKIICDIETSELKNKKKSPFFG